jgi:glucokinase
MVSDTVPDYVLALDFGGTKLAAAVVDAAIGNIIAQKRVATPSKEGAEATLKAIIKIARDTITTVKLDSAINRIGISFGGPVNQDRTTVLHSHHVSDWDGIILTERLSEAFDLPAFMENDANAAALGEWSFGTGERAENMIYVQISTGVGAGLIISGELYRGGALAGEFGHITVLPNGPYCVCGKYGCVESVCSGWAIARDGRAALQYAQPASPMWQLSSGKPEKMHAELVFNAYRAGDPVAGSILQKSFSGLGIGIANMIGLLDPEIVVIGGGIARASDVIRQLLLPILDIHVHHLFKGRYQLEFSQLDGKETLLGAARLAAVAKPD